MRVNALKTGAYAADTRAALAYIKALTGAVDSLSLPAAPSNIEADPDKDSEGPVIS